MKPGILTQTIWTNYLSHLWDSCPSSSFFYPNRFSKLIGGLSNSNFSGNNIVYELDEQIAKAFLISSIESTRLKQFFILSNLRRRKYLTSDWQIVLTYYYAFWGVTCFNLLNWHGHIYLDSANKALLKSNTIIAQTQAIKFKNDHRFKVYKSNNIFQFEIEMAQPASSHDTPWEQFFDIIRHLSTSVSTQTDDYTILSKLLNIETNLGAIFAKEQRHFFNYSYQSSYLMNFSPLVGPVSDLLSFNPNFVNATFKNAHAEMRYVGDFCFAVGTILLKKYFKTANTKALPSHKTLLRHDW